MCMQYSIAITSRPLQLHCARSFAIAIEFYVFVDKNIFLGPGSCDDRYRCLISMHVHIYSTSAYGVYRAGMCTCACVYIYIYGRVYIYACACIDIMHMCACMYMSTSVRACRRGRSSSICMRSFSYSASYSASYSSAIHARMRMRD